MDELSQANQVLWDFLDAVREGDEATVARLLYEPSANRLRAPAGKLAKAFLEAWAVPPDELPRLAIVHTARVIDEELVAFGILVAEPDDLGPMGTNLVKMIDGPQQARAIALIRTDTAEGWQVWGMPEPQDFASAELVSLPPPVVGPMN